MADPVNGSVSPLHFVLMALSVPTLVLFTLGVDLGGLTDGESATLVRIRPTQSTLIQ
jgi:hypothetical protein